MMREVYLDYSATTPVKREVLETMLPFFKNEFGNPSSFYKIGKSSREAINKARKQVADLIGATEHEIFFTSGGSESDNWALIASAQLRSNVGNHIITTKIEHNAVLNTCKHLEELGFEISYLNVDSKGIIDIKELEEAITEKTILISVMFINNEVGTIQPIKEIAEIANKHNILIHTDAVQALGNISIDIKELGIDLMSISSHKIYGPKGVGAMYIKKGLMLPNFIHGGSQEMKRRAGTENVPSIVGFGKAAELAHINMVNHINTLKTLRDYFIDELMNNIPQIDINGDRENRHPGNVNITFNYVESEVLMLYLDLNNIYASAGSACSSAETTPSHVLLAMGLPEEKIASSIRFTLGDFTTKDDIDYTVEKIKEIVINLRELSPFYNEN